MSDTESLGSNEKVADEDIRDESFMALKSRHPVFDSRKGSNMDADSSLVHGAVYERALGSESTLIKYRGNDLPNCNTSSQLDGKKVDGTLEGFGNGVDARSALIGECDIQFWNSVCGSLTDQEVFDYYGGINGPNEGLYIEIEEGPKSSVRVGEVFYFKCCVRDRTDQNRMIPVKSCVIDQKVGNGGFVLRVEVKKKIVFFFLHLSRTTNGEELQDGGDEGRLFVVTSSNYYSLYTSYYRPAFPFYLEGIGSDIVLDGGYMVFFLMVTIPEEEVVVNGASFLFVLIFALIGESAEKTVSRRVSVGNEELVVSFEEYLDQLFRFLGRMGIYEMGTNLEVFNRIRDVKAGVWERRGVEEYLNEELLRSLGSNVGIYSRQYYNGMTLLHYMCALGFVYLTYALLGRMNEFQINMRDINNRNALFYAIDSGKCAIVRELIKRGVEWRIRDMLDETVFSKARMRNGGDDRLVSIVRGLQGNEAGSRAEVYDKRSKVKVPSIHELVRSQERFEEFLAVVGKLRDSKFRRQVSQMTDFGVRMVVPIDSVSNEGATALHVAVSNGLFRQAKVLVEAECDVNARDDYLTTPLMQAIASRDLDCIYLLLDNENVDLELRDSAMRTPIFLAVIFNVRAAFSALVDRGVNLNVRDGWGFTPLHYACMNRNEYMVDVLLENGVDLHVESVGGLTAFYVAVNSGSGELVEKFLEKMEFFSGDGRALSLACSRGYADCVRRLLEKGGDPAVDGFGSKPIYWAASGGSVKCMELLVKAGTDFSVRDWRGFTVLHGAVASFDVDSVEYVLCTGRGAMDDMDERGDTALHRSLIIGSVECAKLLVEFGARVDVLNKFGVAPVHLAAMYGRTEVLRLMMERMGPNLERLIFQRDGDGITLLMHSVPHLDIVKLLVGCGGYMICEDDGGGSVEIPSNIALGVDFVGANLRRHLEGRVGRCAMVLYSGLEQFLAFLNARDDAGKTAFFHAVMGDYGESARLLVKIGVDPFIVVNNGANPLDRLGLNCEDIFFEMLERVREDSRFWRFVEVERMFYREPKVAIRRAIAEGFVDGVESMVDFLVEMSRVNPVCIGEILSEKENEDLRNAFVRRFDFSGVRLDRALREYLTKFVLPGEAQKIDRLIDAMAMRYQENNPGVFPDKDTVLVMLFSLVMLNTDVHSSSIAPSRKMTKLQFVSNHRSLWGPDGADPPSELLEELYDSILSEEIEYIGFVEARKGYMRKYRGPGIHSWVSFWFVLKGVYLYYYRSKSELEPMGLIDLGDVMVLRKSKKSMRLPLMARKGRHLRSCKVGKGGAIVQELVLEVRLLADKVETADIWFRSIVNNQMSRVDHFGDVVRGYVSSGEEMQLDDKLLCVAKAVDFNEFYRMAMFCRSCYNTEEQIRSEYGDEAIGCLVEIGGTRMLLYLDSESKRQYLVLVGDIWTNCELEMRSDQRFNWIKRFKVSSTVLELLRVANESVKSGYDLYITGHSLGSIFAVFLTALLQMEVGRVITFGQPFFMKKMETLVSDRLLIRVIDAKDPVQGIFFGYHYFGHCVTLLDKNLFSYEMVSPRTASGHNSRGELFSAETTKSNKNYGKQRSKKAGKHRTCGMDLSTYEHSIDYYIERLRTKINTDTCHIPYDTL